ncbi:MAG: hypothetical protein ACREBB_10250 [Nitrosotalea sp.]
MALIRDDYSEEVTSESKKELMKFAKWLKEKHGDWPTVIGGWAVWAYHNKGFGSRDVDLVLPDDEWIENVMKNEYFIQNSVKPYKFANDLLGTKHYGKEIKINGREKPEIVFFDLLSGSSLRHDGENLGVYVDWNWAFEFKQTVPFGEAYIHVPEPELLIPLKIIAALARIRTLKQAEDPTYWRSKIWKDYCDVANLASYVPVDKPKLIGHLSSTKLTKTLREEFLAGYISRNDVLEETKTSLPTIENALLPDRHMKGK